MGYILIIIILTSPWTQVQMRRIISTVFDMHSVSSCYNGVKFSDPYYYYYNLLSS